MSFNFKHYQYYIIIGVVSIIALVFLPLIGSEAGLAWNIPDTATGWVVYICTKLLVAGINILIFHCFNMQGKENVKDNELYKEAINILYDKSETQDFTPRGPAEWYKGIYSKKCIAVFATSIFSAVGLTQAILTFDWISMLTYLFTITMGVIFGILQMNEAEEYWTTEFWRYAKSLEKGEKKDD